MPLNTPSLKADIIQASKDAKTAGQAAAQSGGDPITAAQNAFAESLSKAIETYVKSGDVKTTVATTGNATAQSGFGEGKVT